MEITDSAIGTLNTKPLIDYQIVIFDKYFQRNFKNFSTLELIQRITEEATADILPKLTEERKKLNIARSLNDIFEWLLAFANHLFIDLEQLLMNRYLLNENRYCPICGYEACQCEFSYSEMMIKKILRETRGLPGTGVRESKDIISEIEENTDNFIKKWRNYQKELYPSLEPYFLSQEKQEISLEHYTRSTPIIPFNPEKLVKGMEKLLSFREVLYKKKREKRASVWYWIDLFHKIYGDINENKQHWEILTKLIEDLGSLGVNVRKLRKAGMNENRIIICKHPETFHKDRDEFQYLKNIMKKLASSFAWTTALVKKFDISLNTFYHALIKEEIEDYVLYYLREEDSKATLADFEVLPYYPKKKTPSW